MAETLNALITAVYDPEGKKPYAILTGGTPRRLTTFKAEIGEAAKALNGSVAELTYSYSQGQGNDGRVYDNYTLLGVQTGQTVDDEITANGPEGVQAAIEAQVANRAPANGGYGGKSETDRAEIRAAVALKAAVDLIPHLPQDDQRRSVTGSFQLAEKNEAWLRDAVKRNGGEDIFGAPN